MAQSMQLSHFSTQPLHSGLQAWQRPSRAKKFRGQFLWQVPLTANPLTQDVQLLALPSQEEQTELQLAHWLMAVLKSPLAQLKLQMPPIIT
jgi:hypothetical protein